MATKDDSDIPESGAVFTFGKSKFADDLPNKFWVKNDKVLQIACGDEHTALVTESGRVFMFGPNDWGQLGLGNDNKAVNKPSCIKSLKHDKSRLVACGRSHTIVSTASGHVYSFGSNSEGQLGIKDSGDSSTPKRIETLPQEELRMLDAGSDSSVALTEDGRVYVWGGNEDGKLGLGQVDNAEEPTLLAMERPAVCVACGYYHTAIVSDDGKLYTMGEADGGKLGLPEDLESTNVPQHVADIADPVKWVACGSSHTVALTESGEVYVFGDGESGQLGLGTEVLSCSKPTFLKLPFKVSHVFCGQSFTACISEKGQLYTFGDGRHGKLAHGSGDVFSNQFKPFHSKRFSKFLVDKVACGGCHMIVTARPKALNGVEEDDKEETDEMKKTLVSHPVESSGSPSLTRTLSAREKRREEVSRSFSSELNQTLPPPGQSRIIPSLSATMPALKSSPKPAKEDKVENGFVPHLQNGKMSDADSAHGDTEDEDPAQDRHKKESLRPRISPRSALTPRSPDTKTAGGLPPLQNTDKDNGSHRSDGSGGDGDSENEEEDNVDGKDETKKKKKKKKKNGQERRMSQSEKDSSVKEEMEDDSWNDDDDHSDVEDKIENEAVKQLETALLEKDEIKTDEEKDDDDDDSVDKKEEKEEEKGSGKATDDVIRSRGPVPVPRKQKAEDSEDNEEVDEEKLSDKNEDDKEEQLERVESKVEEDLISDKEKEKKSKKDKKKDKEDEEEEDEIVKEVSKHEDEEEEEEKEDSKTKGKDKKKDKKDKKKEKEKDKKKKKGKDEDEEDEKDKDKEDDEEDEKADKKSKDKKKDKKDKKKDKDKEGKGDGKKGEEEDEKGEDENEKEDKKKDKDKKEKDKKKKKGKDDDKERDENGNTEKPPPKKSRTCTIL